MKNETKIQITSGEGIFFDSHCRTQYAALLRDVRCVCVPFSSVRDLGVNLDADVSMTTHVAAVARSCFAALR